MVLFVYMRRSVWKQISHMPGHMQMVRSAGALMSKDVRSEGFPATASGHLDGELFIRPMRLPFCSKEASTFQQRMLEVGTRIA